MSKKPTKQDVDELVDKLVDQREKHLTWSWIITGVAFLMLAFGLVFNYFQGVPTYQTIGICVGVEIFLSAVLYLLALWAEKAVKQLLELRAECEDEGPH